MNGYRFRSVLEARWAVFFDALGIAYEYLAVAPDVPGFWLPEQKYWVVIMPHDVDVEAVEGPIISLADHTGDTVWLIAGAPDREAYTCWLYAVSDGGATLGDDGRTSGSAWPDGYVWSEVGPDRFGIEAGLVWHAQTERVVRAWAAARHVGADRLTAARYVPTA